MSCHVMSCHVMSCHVIISYHYCFILLLFINSLSRMRLVITARSYLPSVQCKSSILITNQNLCIYTWPNKPCTQPMNESHCKHQKNWSRYACAVQLTLIIADKSLTDDHDRATIKENSSKLNKHSASNLY